MTVTLDANQHWTISCLLFKSIALSDAAEKLQELGPLAGNPALAQQEQTDDEQESADCYNKAQALRAGNAYHFPGGPQLTALSAQCTTLEKAIKTSSDATAVIAAATAVRKSVTASSI